LKRFFRKYEAFFSVWDNYENRWDNYDNDFFSGDLGLCAGSAYSRLHCRIKPLRIFLSVNSHKSLNHEKPCTRS
jgi:hypothetical protein